MSTYYDRPVVKEPVWIWAVPAYIYVGGVAGAAAVLGAAAQTVAPEDLQGLVKRSRAIAAVGCAVGGALLIYDLGRPERFLNMLRVFRPTSPMNIGSWVLAGAGSLTSVSALLADARGPARTLGDAAGLGAGFLGLPLSGYTAVLLTNTAMPAWQVHRSLPWLFVASAAAGAASLLEFADLDHREERVVRRFGMVAKVAELIALKAVMKEAARTSGAGRAYEEGVAGSMLRAARSLAVAALATSLLGRRNRALRAPAGAAGTAAAVLVRFGVFHAGKASARDPRATFEQQRAG